MNKIKTLTLNEIPDKLLSALVSEKVNCSFDLSSDLYESVESRGIFEVKTTIDDIDYGLILDSSDDGYSIKCVYSVERDNNKQLELEYV